jgi:molecular chaperone DnaK (HSP70)
VGQPQIEVTFDIDANGIVNVTAWHPDWRVITYAVASRRPHATPVCTRHQSDEQLIPREHRVQQVPWRPVDLDAVCSEAKTTNKFVLVDFFSPK